MVFVSVGIYVLASFLVIAIVLFAVDAVLARIIE